MATNIIYKGELNGTQVDFQTGSLTDISTFDTDVRSSAIQNSITNGVTDRGASQDAIHTMSGFLASNAHPTVTPASNIAIDNSNGTVLQDATFTFDSDGHVTAANFVSKNLNDVYYTEGEINTMFQNTGLVIDRNRDHLDTLSGVVSNNTENTAQLANDVTNLTGLIDQSEADIDTLSGLIDVAEADIVDLSGTMNALTLDDVCDNNATTNQDIQVEDLRVNGGNITGPSTITIDPDSSGPAGTVVIAGNLQVDGTTTTINSTSVQIDDLSLVLGTGVPNAAAADGGGIIIDGTGVANVAEFTFDGSNNRWKTNSLDIEASNFRGALVGNADSATVLNTAISVTVTGDVVGQDSSWDGSDSILVNSTISNNAVTTAKIADDAVTSAKLGSSVAGDNITFTNGVLSVSDSDILAGVQSNLDAKADKTTSMTASDGLTGGGTLASDRSFSTSSAQNHLTKMEFGASEVPAANVITKGGILVLRATNANGLTEDGTNGVAISLNDKTTVSFEGVVQSIDTNQDADNGAYVAMWKVQGVIRRDSDSINMLSSFVTKTFAGASAGSYAINVEADTSNNGLKISSDQGGSTLITSATINFTSIEDAS